jgi:hypothetical protein
VETRRLAEPRYAEAMHDAQQTLDRELSGYTDGRRQPSTDRLNPVPVWPATVDTSV